MGAPTPEAVNHFAQFAVGDDRAIRVVANQFIMEWNAVPTVPKTGRPSSALARLEPSVTGSAHVMARAISRNRQSALASFIWRGERHSGWNNRGLATRIAAHRAREVATLRRLALYRNSIPRGASSGREVAIE